MSPEVFYYIKGLVALVATAITVVHMNTAWDTFDRDGDGVRVGIGQRMRYISWFLFLVLIAAASKEQITEGVEISRRNVGALGVISFALLTAIVSLVEAYRFQKRRH